MSNINIKTSEAAIITARQAKATAIRLRNENPFANDVQQITDIISVRIKFSSACHAGKYNIDQITPAAFCVAGRILFLRSFGSITFIRLRDRTGELQISCEERLLGEYYNNISSELDLGDIIEVSGTATATPKGELSLNANTMRLLTKSYRPLPTKTTFKNVESRYRQRYVDLVANPGVASVFRARSSIVSTLRSFLDDQGFLEVETPTMHSLVGGAAAKPFSTHHNALDVNLFMRIAPELYLKRLVVGGFERVYEIARCYRNEGLSTRHNPEFTMLEYYQAYANYNILMDQTENLLRYVDQNLAERYPSDYAVWSASRTFSFDTFVRVTMNDAIHNALSKAGLSFEVINDIDKADAPIKQWAKIAKDHSRDIDWSNFKKAVQKCQTIGERMFVAYEYIAELYLTVDYRTSDNTKSVPVFITDYPFETSPLARRKDSDPSLVDRFELFIDGRELCNAFSELNDPEDQAARFQSQLDNRHNGDEESMDYDEDYIRALEYGMPPTAGFGMGVDRLVMLLTGASSIRDVILFPLMRQEK